MTEKQTITRSDVGTLSVGKDGLPSVKPSRAVHQIAPQMSANEIDFLGKLIAELGVKSVLEWGSGGSTFYFRKLGLKVTSIEHNARWAARTGAFLVPPDKPPERENRAWADLTEAEPGMMAKYVSAPLGLPLVDLVLVDGRARSACVPAGWTRLRVGGAILLHDAGRYRRARLALEQLGPVSRFESFAIARKSA